MRLAALTFLLLLLAGSAQAYELQVDPPAEPVQVQPEASVEVALPWTVTCDAPEVPPAQGPGTLRLTAQAPSGILMSSAPHQVEWPLCPGQRDGSLPMQLSATRDAPGIEALSADLGFALAWTTAVGNASSTAEATLPIRVAYQGLLVARAETTIKQGEPRGLSTFSIEVRNAGNAATSVHVRLPDDGNWTAEEVPVIGVGETVRFNVTYRHGDDAGFDNDETTAAITLTPSASDGSEGRPVTLNLLVRTRTDLSVPGPALPLVIVGLVLARRFA